MKPKETVEPKEPTGSKSDRIRINQESFKYWWFLDIEWKMGHEHQNRQVFGLQIYVQCIDLWWESVG